MRILILLPGAESNYPAGHLPPALESRQGVLRDVVGVNTTVEVGALDAGSPSMHVAGGTSGQLAMMAEPVIARVRRAEAEGYDAVVQYGSFDPGTEAARHFVNIPVVGTGKAALLTAMALGDRLAGIVYQESLVTVAHRMLRAYGVESWFVSVEPIEIPAPEMHARADEVRERLIRVSRDAMEQHRAQVIVPLGMSMVPAIVAASDLTQEVGVPVVDGLTAAVRMAESLVLMGLTQSVKAYPAAR